LSSINHPISTIYKFRKFRSQKYNYIRNDIINSISYFDKPLLIFDDYGLFPNSVMKCINEFVDNNTLKVIKKIGHKKDVIFPNTAHKVLKDFEGIICQVV